TLEPRFDSTQKCKIDDFIESKKSNLFQTHPEELEYDNEITIEELNAAIKSLNKKSAPGPDKITNKHFLNLTEKGIYVLLKIVNLSWLKSEILEDWKIAKITMIEKDQNDRNNPLKYRP
ncbi:RNA-directed DNA polymerase from mobile element jockey-like, partial [Brachionus plicatilis]